MRVYERSGVTVDQCTECRGIFLDRGELEKLFEAESSWNSRQGHSPAAPQPAAYAPPPPPPPAAAYGQTHGQPAYGQTHGQPAYGPGYPTPGYPAPAYGHHGHYKHHGHYRGRKQKGFLHNLFD